MRTFDYAAARANHTTRGLDPAFVRMPFALRRDDRFFFFGSCTARQMERSFRIRGLDVPSTPPASPPIETVLGARAVDRHYVPVIEQELTWASGEALFPERALIDMPRGLCVDLQLPASRAVERRRALERRAEMKRYFSRTGEANVFIVDLCFADGWYDRETGLALNFLPPDWYARTAPDRFEYQVWQFDDCLSALRRLCARLLAFGDDRRVVLTTNPTSLAWTFSPGDLTTATVRRNSLWIAAAAQLAEEEPRVAAYPLFEALTWPDQSRTFDEHAHVRDDRMDQAMAAMLHAFGLYVDVSLEGDYDEAAYLAGNPDVAEAVAAGRLTSGYRHWYAEGRQLAPEAAPESAEEAGVASLGVRLSAVVPERVPSARRFALDVDIENVGTVTYRSTGPRPVYLCYRWFDAAGAWTEIGRSVHTALTAPLEPGRAITRSAVVATPNVAGRYTLALTLLKQNVAWFDDLDAANGQRSEVVVEAWDADLPA